MKPWITAFLIFLASASAFAVPASDQQKLRDAIIENRGEVVRDYLLAGGSPDVLIAGTDVNVRNPKASLGAPALKWAMQYLRPEIVELLVEAGASWQTVYSNEVNFFDAIIANGMEGVVTYLLETDPTALATTGPPGDGPIELASGYGYYGLVDQMLATASRAGLNIDDRLNVALLLSLSNGHEDIARLLIKHGADTTQPGALHLAVGGSNAGMVRDWIKSGASVQGNFQGVSMLDQASARLRAEATAAADGRQIFIELMFAGADVCSYIKDKEQSGKALPRKERKDLNKVLGLMASLDSDCNFHPFDLEPASTSEVR